ncbi:hypothetical protein CRG49_005295 [Neisseria sp. N95_16]|uniref:Uncharacterized protein n=1 Tax=Neisseria brasiliensis TaxID=2666100 RepID=A0A5Q3RZC5_9NEIS|nr:MULTISPECIES: hypothetical protein [Neisseria]MRN38119.1 hypothetical protein [Neisseria brasiliensis]PJO09893.1 hypothetical protein CRG49_005295 [Neisseria sp. N95_16]QGL25109.1 hypothetical protein GJV52_05905 [Neisseria brasiliensis]
MRELHINELKSIYGGKGIAGAVEGVVTYVATQKVTQEPITKEGIIGAGVGGAVGGGRVGAVAGAITTRAVKEYDNYVIVRPVYEIESPLNGSQIKNNTDKSGNNYGDKSGNSYGG